MKIKYVVYSSVSYRQYGDSGGNTVVECDALHVVVSGVCHIQHVIIVVVEAVHHQTHRPETMGINIYVYKKNNLEM